ncbi:immunity protein Imm33 domain-containing protein [Enterococcus caccae]|uniref:Imm33-like domain-containing protein n=1 Tax=Enterococcus caccae ATCC BAA-1240 TaxID=1158612 RepID=R3TVA7_9ENTE|nr:hypothetical protein [Enterococcus caccae]EOL45083.1 hypothetical protein UC7_01889 [Enterococcus caccae ATCC BAA-1240]EOT58490.1 hypothetical protein I580_02661 [Enterococcus caccae ATCC BAA-1240]OJG27181.1 hypothetical protein RU98_GL002961 [Enterococcus caccae]
MREFKQKLGSKEFIATVEKELEPQLLSLFYILKNMNEEELINGFSFQIGWSIYFLEEINKDSFVILTSDTSKNPFEDKTKDLTLALWVQLEQDHFLRKLNLEGKSISFSDKIILQKNILTFDTMYMQRSSDVEPGDSGWYIGSIEEDNSEEDLYALYAYQLLKQKPEIIQVLALPDEYMVIYENNEIKTVLNENDEPVL